MHELKQELPQLKHFVTLSPVPNFAQWLAERSDDESLSTELREVIGEMQHAGWHRDNERTKALGALLRPLAARYLAEEKNARGLPLNPVVRFHLGNGAELHRINWLGDISAKGLEQGAGLMVNYLYMLNDIKRNYENYTAHGTVACSSEVKDLA